MTPGNGDVYLRDINGANYFIIYHPGTSAGLHN